MKIFQALLLGAVFTLFASLNPARGAIDVMENGGAGDGLGDIWQLMNGAGAFDPNADPDGDGATNANEAGAGTDPKSPEDQVRVRMIEIVNGNTVLTWPSVIGKRYRIQTTQNLAGTWTDASGFMDGTDADITGSLPAVPRTFYRIAVYDKDTDGDGVTDWEELK